MSIVNTNPFKGDRQTHWQEFCDNEIQPSTTAAFNTPETMANEYHHEPNGMSHSHSENNVTFMVAPKPMNASRLNLSANHKHTVSYSKTDERGFPLPSADRGRPPIRTPSPIKRVERAGGETMLESPQSPSTRQRSPMKKMFGENGWLGRSTSMKELPSEQYRKTGLKHWGGKIKQRVEDLVTSFHLLHTPYTQLIIRTEDGRRNQTPPKPLQPRKQPRQTSYYDQIPDFNRPTHSSEDILRNRAHDLCDCKQVPHDAASGRPHVD